MVSPTTAPPILHFGIHRATIQHVSGKNNPVADALSRATINALHNGFVYSVMAECQHNDPETKDYLTSVTSVHFEDIEFGFKGVTLLCDIVTGQSRPIVPSSLRRAVFDIIHNLAHPSIRTTRRIVAQKFVWHGLNKQVRPWAKYMHILAEG